MSISLNNHESRIAALENKINQSGAIVESNKSGNGYVRFHDGLTINWGAIGNGWRGRVNFVKPYSSFVRLGVAQVYDIKADGDYATVTGIDNKGFTFNGTHAWTAAQWIAIGYLISNRVLSLVKSLFFTIKVVV